MINFNPSQLLDEAVDLYEWGSIVERDNPLSAQKYFEFSQDDLSDGVAPRNLINALSNAKKSLHIRLEDICLGFGLVNARKKNFPQLINYIRECGIVAPKILNRINNQRNAVEHDYLVPTEDEVSIFIDVVCLFLAATDRWIKNQPSAFDYYDSEKTSELKGPRLSRISFNWDKGQVSLIFRKNNSYIDRNESSIVYSSPDPDFFQCVKFAIKNSY